MDTMGVRSQPSSVRFPPEFSRQLRFGNTVSNFGLVFFRNLVIVVNMLVLAVFYTKTAD